MLERDAARRPARWIWVHHAPPAGSPTSWDGERSFGDAVLRGWIERHQPDLVLSGHVHQSPFTRGGSWADRIGATWVFNAGHQIGPLPSHIIVDTEQPGAYWVLAGCDRGRTAEWRAEPPVRTRGHAADLAAGYGSAGRSAAGMKLPPCSWASDSNTSSTMPRWSSRPRNCRFRSTR